MTKRVVLFFLTAMLIGSQVTAAERFFIAAHTGGSGAQSFLWELDPVTGDPFLKGPTGFANVTAMDFHPITGELYAIGRRPSDGTFVLLFINPSNGHATELVALSVQPHRLYDMSFRGSDNVLYVVLNLDDITTEHIARVDLLSGVVTVLGPTGEFEEGNGLGFDMSDTLYTINGEDVDNIHFTVDQSDGSLALNGFIDFDPFPTTPDELRVNSLDFIPGLPLAFALINGGSGGDGPNFVGMYDPDLCEVEILRDTVPGAAAIVITSSPLLVSLESFEVERTRQGVRIRWKTFSEIDNAGFRVLRREAGEIGKKPISVTPDIIRPMGTEFVGAQYELFDTLPMGGASMAYYLEDIDVYGVTTLHGPIYLSAGPEATYRVRKTRELKPGH